MTVKELREILDKYPSTLHVVIELPNGDTVTINEVYLHRGNLLIEMNIEEEEND